MSGSEQAKPYEKLILRTLGRYLERWTRSCPKKSFSTQYVQCNRKNHEVKVLHNLSLPTVVKMLNLVKHPLVALENPK